MLNCVKHVQLCRYVPVTCFGLRKLKHFAEVAKASVIYKVSNNSVFVVIFFCSVVICGINRLSVFFNRFEHSLHQNALLFYNNAPQQPHPISILFQIFTILLLLQYDSLNITTVICCIKQT